jgi:Flp pilus assembly pilin Flp
MLVITSDFMYFKSNITKVGDILFALLRHVQRFFPAQSLAKDQRGATIIEFALVAPILFLMVFAVIEFSLVMYSTSVVENATAAASRYGITGNNYDASMTRDEYIRASIDKLSMGLVKPDDIKITTEKFGDFQGVNSSGSGSKADYGSGNETVLYHVGYDWKIATPMIAQFFDGGIFPIRATALVKNEKF